MLFPLKKYAVLWQFSLISDRMVSESYALERVNHSICQSNKAELFVTVWLGILELSTGKLKAANAGHEYPAIQRAGGVFEICKVQFSLARIGAGFGSA